ncbi:MAG: hypothetical protein ACTH31_03180 [Pseudoclavibacter sp.]
MTDSTDAISSHPTDSTNAAGGSVVPAQPAPPHDQAPPQEHWPGVIPYVEAYSGARRLLTLDGISSGNAVLPPVVSIDGRQYFTFWGRVTFEIPAERGVHLSVHLEGDSIRGARSALIPPGGHVHYVYQERLFGADLTFVAPPVG